MMIAGAAQTEGAKSTAAYGRDVWDGLYRRHGRAVYRFLLKLTLGDERAAEDLLQETFLRSWHWSQTHVLDLSRIEPWLFTVARRVAIDAARYRRARPSEVVLPRADSFIDADDQIERYAQAEVVRQALLGLSRERAATLIELFYNDRSPKEAAAVLGIPEGTVKSRAFYALRALRQVV